MNAARVAAILSALSLALMVVDLCRYDIYRAYMRWDEDDMEALACWEHDPHHYIGKTSVIRIYDNGTTMPNDTVSNHRLGQFRVCSQSRTERYYELCPPIRASAHIRAPRNYHFLHDSLWIDYYSDAMYTIGGWTDIKYSEDADGDIRAIDVILNCSPNEVCSQRVVRICADAIQVQRDAVCVDEDCKE